jgi:DNA mismatch repair protein MutL
MADTCALLERNGKLSILALPVAERWLRQAQLTPGDATICAQPLLIPLRLKAREDERKTLKDAQATLSQLGIEILLEGQHVTVRAVPLPLRQQNLQILIPELIGYLVGQSHVDAGNIAQWLARNLASDQAQWNTAQAIGMLADVERLCPQLVKSPPGGLLQPVDLDSAMNALRNE